MKTGMWKCVVLLCEYYYSVIAEMRWGEGEIYPGFSLVELLHYCSLIGGELHSDATPALLCHKEPARRIQSPLLGALERKIPPLGGILLAPRWFFMA